MIKAGVVSTFGGTMQFNNEQPREVVSLKNNKSIPVIKNAGGFEINLPAGEKVIMTF